MRILIGLGALLLATEAWAQGASLTIRADVQEANAITGVIVATGNVQISYPAQNLVATAQRATYFTKEQRVVLEGGVSVTQNANRLQAETITYLISEGTIQARPASGQQVETIYVFE
ncbi:MAG: LptA/OstA family protein [Thermostichales cyanobacterium DRC_bins_46]